jgi:hypothetical protein
MNHIKSVFEHQPTSGIFGGFARYDLAVKKKYDLPFRLSPRVWVGHVIKESVPSPSVILSPLWVAVVRQIVVNSSKAF